MKVWWNDQLVERDEVRIDMEDRGYQFGDGLYEVVRAYNGKLFTADEHIARMFAGAKKIELKLPFGQSELKDRLTKIIEVNQIDTGNIYFQVTRGVASPRNHAYPDETKVKPVFTASTTVVPRNVEKLTQGFAVITQPDMRWLHCDIKSISLLGNVMAKHEAHKVGAEEAILHRDGIVTECSASNAWIVKNDVIYTHPDSNLILAGITKKVLLQVARETGFAVKEETFSLAQLREADEIFCSSTTLEATPIISLDGALINGGKRGPVVEKLQELYKTAVEEVCGKIS